MTKSLIRRARAFYRVNPVYSDCPSCKSSASLQRSHSRNFKEKFVSKLLFHKYYRCKECGWRGAIKTIRFKAASLLVILFYMLLILTAGFITHQILKRLL